MSEYEDFLRRALGPNMSGMVSITKEFNFSASHILDTLPSWHQCARMHGHNYVVVLELSAYPEELTEAGFVRDYRELDAFKRWIDETVDHRHLNEVMEISPSAENLALWLYSIWIEKFPELTAVRVSETPKTLASYPTYPPHPPRSLAER